MEHYIYSMLGGRPDPVGTGDTKSWFYYYKWPEEGEVFLPLKPPNLEVKEGDRVWLFMDSQLVGTAVLLRTDINNESLPDLASQELWFDAAAKLDLREAWVKDGGPNKFVHYSGISPSQASMVFYRVNNLTWKECLLSFLEEGT